MATPPSQSGRDGRQQQRAGGRLRQPASSSSSSSSSSPRQAEQPQSSVRQQLAVSERAGQPATLRIRCLVDVPPEFLRLYQRQPVLRSFTRGQIRTDSCCPVAPLLVQSYVRRSEAMVRQFSQGDPTALVAQFADEYTGRIHSSLPSTVMQATHRGISGFFAVMGVLMTHFLYTAMDVSVEPCQSESPLLARVVLKGRCSVRMCRSKREVTWPFVRYWSWDIRQEKVVAAHFFEYDQELAEAFAAEEREAAEQAAALTASFSEQDGYWDAMHGSGSSAAVLLLSPPAVSIEFSRFLPLSDAADAALPIWDSGLRDGCDVLQLGTGLPIGGEGGEMEGLAATPSFLSLAADSELPVAYPLLSPPAMLEMETRPHGHPVSAVIATAVDLGVPEPARPPPLVWAEDAEQEEAPPPPRSSSSSSSSSSGQSRRPSASQSLCKLHRLLPDCERELAASVSGPGHRGIRCICWRCQLVCCVPSTDGSSPTMFRPFLISTERALLLRIVIARNEQVAAAALQAPKRRLVDVGSHGSTSSSSSSSSRLTVRSRRRAQPPLGAELKKIDVQGRRANRDRSVRIAGSTGEAHRELLAKRLTVLLSDAEERYLYVFASAQELEMALQHWLEMARDLTAMQLLCHRLREAIVLKYHHAGQEIQIDPQQLQQLSIGDRQLVHGPSANSAQLDAGDSSSSSSLPSALSYPPVQVAA